MTTLIEIKKQAHLLHDFLKKNNSTIKLSSCFQAMAKINGFKDWNTMLARLKTQADSVKQTRGYISGFVEIDEVALLSLANKGSDGQLDEDSYRLLCAMLFRLENNSPFVKLDGLAKILWMNQERFTQTLTKLIRARYINCIFNSNSGEYIIQVNPNHFWKGNPEKHDEVIECYMKQVENNQIADEIAAELYVKRITKSGLRGKKPVENIDSSEVIAFAEHQNSKNYYPTKIPFLKFENSNTPNKHPKLKALQNFLKQQKSVADPRVYLEKIKEVLGESYYVGHGGTYIFIKMAGSENIIATITAGLNLE